MTAAELDFVVPSSLAEAIAALENPGAMALGGGTAMGLLLKNRLIEPEHLVWIGALRELSGIAIDDAGTLRIGATTTLRELEASAVIVEEAPMIAEAAGKVGNPRVRSTATLGGALVHGDPRQDIPPVLLAQRARLTIARRDGQRELDIAEFYLGFMDVAIEENEIVTEVVIPSRRGWREAYSRFTPGSEDDYPTVGVAATVRRGSGGEIEDAEIALGGVDASAILVSEASRAVIGTRGSVEDLATAATIAAAACNPSDDQRGSAAYKRAMVEVWTRRTLAACLD